MKITNNHNQIPTFDPNDHDYKMERALDPGAVSREVRDDLVPITENRTDHALVGSELPVRGVNKDVYDLGGKLAKRTSVAHTPPSREGALEGNSEVGVYRIDERTLMVDGVNVRQEANRQLRHPRR